MTPLPRVTPVECDAKVVANRPVVPGGAILALAAGGPFPAPSAGQFVHVRLPGDTPLLRRPFSVLGHSPVPGGARLELMYAVVGTGTALLHRLAPGDRLNLIGPLGNHFALGEARRVILVAGGRGAVPLYRLLESGEANGREVVFLFGARSSEYLWGLDRLAGVEHRLATIDGSAGVAGTVIDLLAAELKSSATGARAAHVCVLACGPEVMLRRVAETAAEHGVESQVALENQMGCAIGVCRGCVIPRRLRAGAPWPRDGNARYATVCKEGPVFFGNDVDWAAMAHAESTVPRSMATI
jgi:dihydroorotate dehydrogenase electron transfer subunit